MPGMTVQTAAAILKTVYPGFIEDQLNDEVVLYRKANRKKKKITQGLGLVRSIRIGRSQGLGARDNSGPLPKAGKQRYAAPTVNVARNYHRGQIEGAVIRDSDGDEAAFEEALAAETQFNVDDLVNELDWQLYRGTGKRAQVNGAVTIGDVTFTVDNPGTDHIQEEMVIDIYNGATLQALNLTVSVVSSATVFVVESGSATTVSNDAWIYRHGNFDGTTVKELKGLQVIVDDTTFGNTYFGLSKVTYPGLKAGYIDASVGTLSETDMQAAIDGARKKGGGRIDLILTSYGVRRAYAASLLSQKRYVSPHSQSLKGGFKQSGNFDDNTGSGLAYDDVEVVPGKNAVAGRMDFLDTRTFKLFEQSDVEWVDNGGSILHPMMASDDLDAYQFAMYHEAQLYCERPSANSALSGITEG